MTEAEALLKVQPILTNLAGKYAYVYNLDRDELLGAAQSIALRAVRTWVQEEQNCSITSWVYWQVSSYYRGRLDRPGWKRRHGRGGGAEIGEVLALERFSLRAFIFELSEQAQEAVRLAITYNLRRTRLIRTLRSLGWEGREISRVFEEIREALNG